MWNSSTDHVVNKTDSNLGRGFIAKERQEDGMGMFLHGPKVKGL